jgi:hypothetical protein
MTSQGCERSRSTGTIPSPRIITAGATRLARDERGQVVILAAATLIVMFGLAALAVDGSYMYNKRNRLGAAADAAAKMCAREVQRNPTVTNASLQNFANQEVAVHGFSPGAPTSVTINHPPASGPFAGDSHYVEAILSEATSTFFGHALGWTSVSPGARAVAGATDSVYCFITFQTMGWGNNDNLTATHCSVADGGNLNLGNNTTISADNVDVTGTWNGTGTVSNLNLSAPYPTDPLANLPPPTDPGGSCTTPLNISANITIDPGKYCGWHFAGGNLTLNSGIYYITGPIDDNNPGTNVTITGTGGVMIYLAPGASINFDSNFVTISLTGMSSGPYKGITFYQDRSNTNDAVLAKNNSNITLDGALYFPSAALTMKNNGLSANPCGLIVAKTVTVKNNATLSLDHTCGDFGGSLFQTISLAE